MGSSAIATTHHTGKIEKSEKVIRIAWAPRWGSHLGSRRPWGGGAPPALGTVAVSSVGPSGAWTARFSVCAMAYVSSRVLVSFMLMPVMASKMKKMRIEKAAATP
ncbi:hypothetical protein D3C72_708290 [compost metagenome]